METVSEKPNGRGFMRIVRAGVCSWQGFKAAWRHEAAFRQEALLAIVLIPLGLWLGQGGVQRALLAGSVLLVPIAALNNTLDMGSYVLLVTWAVLGVNLFTPEFKSSPTQISQIPDDIDH